jgi:hypothetical protein
MEKVFEKLTRDLSVRELWAFLRLRRK